MISTGTQTNRTFATASAPERAVGGALIVSGVATATATYGAAVLRTAFDEYAISDIAASAAAGGAIFGVALGLAAPRRFDEVAGRITELQLNDAIVPVLCSAVFGAAIFGGATDGDLMLYAISSASVGILLLQPTVNLVHYGVSLVRSRIAAPAANDATANLV